MTPVSGEDAEAKSWWRAASVTYLFSLCVLILVFGRFFLLPLCLFYHSRRRPSSGLLALSFLFLLLFIPLGKEIVQAFLWRYIRHFQRATLTSLANRAMTNVKICSQRKRTAVETARKDGVAP